MPELQRPGAAVPLQTVETSSGSTRHSAYGPRFYARYDELPADLSAAVLLRP